MITDAKRPSTHQTLEKYKSEMALLFNKMSLLRSCFKAFLSLRGGIKSFHEKNNKPM
jgi:hypothetical protein